MSRSRRSPKRKTKSDKPYLEVHVVDSCDNIMLRAWEDAPVYKRCKELLEHGHCVEISGEFSHHATFGLEARSWDFRPLNATEKVAFMGGSKEVRERQEADFQFIAETVQGLTDPRLRILCEMFLVENGERFRRTAAARSFHHARRGGLVEHTSQMMRSAVALSGVYKKLNRDLLIAGVLFHDSGKLWENHVPEDKFAIEHCERGELLGHINMGIEIVNNLWRQLKANDAFSAWRSFMPSSESVRLHFVAPHRQPPRGDGVRLAGRAEDAGSVRAALHRQSRRQDGDGVQRLHDGADRRAEHLRQGPAAARLPDRAAQAVSDGERSHRRLAGRAGGTRARPGLNGCGPRFRVVMPTASTPAAKFIEDAVNHPEWLKIIETGQADAVVKLAQENGFECSLDDLKQAAKDLLAGTPEREGEGHPDKKETDDAAAGMSDLANDTGYGNDTGYAALYGVAGVILKM